MLIVYSISLTHLYLYLMDYERSSCFANRLRADQPDQSHTRIKTLLNVSQLTADKRDYDDDDDGDGDDDDDVGDDIDDEQMMSR